MQKSERVIDSDRMLEDVDMWEFLRERSSELQAGAASVTAVFALIALVIAGLQITSSNSSAAENRAQEAYRDYLKLCIEYPELSSYRSYAKARNGSKPEELYELREKYHWFISVLLHTGEQILEEVSSDGAWRATVERQVEYHRPELMLIWAKYADNFDGSMKELVDHVVSPEFEPKFTDHMDDGGKSDLNRS